MKKVLLTLTAFATLFQTALAGGYLTNTNHSIAFLREPSRDAVIAIDGAYSNPAGLLFLPEGLQVQFNYQNVVQHRYVESTFAPFVYGADNNGSTTKKYEGEAKAPFLPSLHLSYNLNDKWNINGGFMVVGGGGKCEFDKGLGSFEAAASLLPVLGSQAGLDIKGYSINSFMRGKQYYFGTQIGVGYKVNEQLAVSLQGRFVYGLANYYGHIKDISVITAENPEGMLAKDYFINLRDKALTGAGQYEALGMQEQANALKAKAAALDAYATRTEDVTLNCDEKGYGFTPVIGIDWRLNEQWNFAAKYEFKTRMRLKNTSANSESANKLEQLNQFKDGYKVKEDIPAYLTLGVQYSPVPSLNINAGWHCYYDKNAAKENDAQDLIRHNTHEWSAGIEWNCWKDLTISGGWQNTCYGNSDAYMKDISFTTSSNTYGFGFGYKLNDHWYADLGYFFTVYKKYTKETDNYNDTSIPGKDVFWRDNKVVGVGITYKL